MGFINDDGVVCAQQWIALRLRKQNAIRHELDGGLRPNPILKPDLVAHHLAQRRLKLLRQTLGHTGGGQTPWLRVANQSATVDPPPPECQRHFGQLGGFA